MVRLMGQPTTRPTSVNLDEVLSRRLRARALLTAALGPVLGGYLAVLLLLVLIVAGAEGSRFSLSGVLAASGPAWLAAYQVPLQIGGQPLGILPLGPTVVIGALVARSARIAGRRIEVTSPSRATMIVGVMAGAHLLASAPVALLATGTGGLAVQPVAAVVMPALIAASCAAVGLSRRCGIAAALRTYLDPTALRGLRAGLLGLTALLTAGALAFTLATVLSASTASRLFAVNAPNVGSAVGVLLLCLGYLPNAVVMAAGFTAGPGFSIGAMSVSPFTFSGGMVPAIPLLAGMPQRQAVWWPALLLLPALAGVLVGWSLRHADASPVARLRMVVVAGAFTALGSVVLGALAGGRLAQGSFDPVALPLGLLSIAAFGWIAVPAGLLAWFGGPRARRRTTVAARDLAEQPQPSEDADDEERQVEVEDQAEAKAEQDGEDEQYEGATGHEHENEHVNEQVNEDAVGDEDKEDGDEDEDKDEPSDGDVAGEGAGSNEDRAADDGDAKRA
ncbi:hypothetical protein SacmaDRAFT_0790 [Saccharomonospora marina XMU15]|uniref:Uncharacterized protein n=2 Tax=Saccharomonospora TaxID=1851 RepID=H5X7C5_9PSEU|nr:hypothetical protein SacmaDRAFT_0790 [Saccharomonospora marina XMU15]